MARFAHVVIAATALLVGQGSAHAELSRSDASDAVASVWLDNVTTADLFSSVNAGMTIVIHENLTKWTTSSVALSADVDVVSEGDRSVG